VRTAASESMGPERRHPWPSPHPAWQDPPWLLAGRVVTAWFMVPWHVAEGAMSPDLLPERTDEVRIRLRFYELTFEALGENPGQSLAPTEGNFREAVVGFPARFGELVGEVSLFMWTDSDTYLMWAREAFGWPLLRGDITLEGGMWSRDDLQGASGRAVVDTDWGSAELLEATVSDPTGSGSPAAWWLTPRRLVQRGGLDGERRELLAVRPGVRKAGERYSGSGRVAFDFREPHPLAALGGASAELELADGFELLVAETVEVQ
jgi:hypothetical protein